MKRISNLLILSLIINMSIGYSNTNIVGLNLSLNEILIDDDKMIYPIYIYGSEVLREPTIEIAKEYPQLAELITSMFATMHSSDGVGVAAPQIGKGIRVFVIDVPLAVEEGEESKSFVEVFINPKIYEYSEDVCTITEGCLSIPGLSEDVVRPSTIKIKYLDENFVEHDMEFSGFVSRVIQHEYDHLEGVLYIDRVVPSLKELMDGDLKAIKRGEFSAEYETQQTNN